MSARRVRNCQAASYMTASLQQRLSLLLVSHHCAVGDTGVDKGGAQPPPLNGRAKKKGRGYFYQMSNTYTCIAYLIEIRQFCSKNLVHKGVNFEAQNALKLTYEHL